MFMFWKYWDLFELRKIVHKFMLNEKIKVLDSWSLNTNVHRHVLKLWFVQWNMELNCLMLDLHTYRMLKLRKFVRFLWIKHSLYVDDWSPWPMFCWYSMVCKLAKLETLAKPHDSMLNHARHKKGTKGQSLLGGIHVLPLVVAHKVKYWITQILNVV